MLNLLPRKFIFLFIAIWFLLTGIGFANTDKESIDREWTPFEVSWMPPLQLFKDRDVYGLRLNLLIGDNPNVRGIDLGIGNFTESFEGIQLGVGNAIKGGDFTGIQFAGFFNLIAPMRLPLVKPIQFKGIQIGLLNWGGGAYKPKWAKHDRNYRATEIKTTIISGVQLGCINVTKGLYGLQFAGLNMSSETNGLQIGIVNLTDDLTGIQIGLVNIAKNAPFSFFPIINASF